MISFWSQNIFYSISTCRCKNIFSFSVRIYLLYEYFRHYDSKSNAEITYLVGSGFQLVLVRFLCIPSNIYRCCTLFCTICIIAVIAITHHPWNWVCKVFIMKNILFWSPNRRRCNALLIVMNILTASQFIFFMN